MRYDPALELFLLQKLLYPGRHRLPIVEVIQDKRGAQHITPKIALIQHLPRGKGTTAGIPGQAKQPDALFGRGRSRVQVAVNLSGQGTMQISRRGNGDQAAPARWA